MSDIKTLLATKAKRPERTVFVCVAADLVQKHQILEAELQELLIEERREGKTSKRLNSTPASVTKAAEVRAVEEEMADATIEVHLRAVTPSEWRAWRNSNPPRDDVTLDQQFGMDTDALITDMVRRCLVTPEMDDDDWSTWLAEVASAEQERCAVAVYEMHERRVDVPKSRLVSLVTGTSGDESKPLPGSE